jgi:hypothetical protein
MAAIAEGRAGAEELNTLLKQSQRELRDLERNAIRTNKAGGVVAPADLTKMAELTKIRDQAKTALHELKEESENISRLRRGMKLSAHLAEGNFGFRTLAHGAEFLGEAAGGGIAAKIEGMVSKLFPIWMAWNVGTMIGNVIREKIDEPEERDRKMTGLDARRIKEAREKGIDENVSRAVKEMALKAAYEDEHMSKTKFNRAFEAETMDAEIGFKLGIEKMYFGGQPGWNEDEQREKIRDKMRQELGKKAAENESEAFNTIEKAPDYFLKHRAEFEALKPGGMKALKEEFAAKNEGDMPTPEQLHAMVQQLVAEAVAHKWELNQSAQAALANQKAESDAQKERERIENNRKQHEADAQLEDPSRQAIDRIQHRGISDLAKLQAEAQQAGRGF